MKDFRVHETLNHLRTLMNLFLLLWDKKLDAYQIF